jgi:hypothetical protein
LAHALDLIAFGVHTLLIGYVIASLDLPARGIGWTAGDGRAAHKSSAGPDGSPGAHIAGCRTEHGAYGCAGHRAHGHAVSQIRVGHLVRRPAGLPVGPLPARDIFILERLEAFARRWPHHYAGTGGHGGASEQEGGDKRRGVNDSI